MDDMISRQTAIKIIKNYCENGCDIAEDNWCPSCQREQFIKLLEALPSEQPTLCGYDIRHLMLIADVLRKENLPPERVSEALADIGRIVSIVSDEFEEALRKSVEGMWSDGN